MPIYQRSGSKTHTARPKSAGSIAWRKRIITAPRRRRIVGGGVAVAVIWVRRSIVHRRTIGGATRNARKRQWREWQADDVDEHRSWPVRTFQIAFQNLHLERQLIALKTRILQHDHGISGKRAIFAERRYSRIWWILRETGVGRTTPFLQQ